jgi:hypothetical protein
MRQNDLNRTQKYCQLFNNKQRNKNMKDLTYTQDKMFTRFYAESQAGIEAYNTMARQLGGVAAVLNSQASNVLYQLRKAGYKVSKAKPTNMTIDEILKELENL